MIRLRKWDSLGEYVHITLTGTPSKDEAEMVTRAVHALSHSLAADQGGPMDPTRRALFMCATHCQGGHSDAGAAAAEVLGVPFPLTMPDLIAKARSEGANPAALWPWMITQHGTGPHRFFTADEIVAAGGRKTR